MRLAKAFGGVLVLNAAVLGLALTFEPIIEPNFEPFLFAAVAFSAWAWGFRPALFSSALGAATLVLLFLPPHYTLSILSSQVLFRELFFCAAAVFLSFLITRLGSALERVRAAEARMRVAVENLPVFLFTQDRELRYTWGYNSAISPFADPPLGRTDAGIHDAETARWLAGIKREVIEKRQGKRTEFTLPVGDGKQRVVDLTLEPMRNEAGAVTGVIGAALDITDRKLIEERLRTSQRMESVGIVAAGMAHDFNNLLAIITSANDIALSHAPDERGAGLLRTALDAAERAARLVAQLLAYVGKDVAWPTAVDVSGAIRGEVPKLEQWARPGIRCSFDLPDGLPAIHADPAHIEQIAVNLFVNAAEAIGGGEGAITVATGMTRLAQADLDHAQVRAETAGPGRYVFLEVRDTGGGIRASDLSRIFDPFYSTKFLGRGLGLAAVQGIVLRYSGAIRVRTTASEGSTFTVLIPCEAERQRNAATRI